MSNASSDLVVKDEKANPNSSLWLAIRKNVTYPRPLGKFRRLIVVCDTGRYNVMVTQTSDIGDANSATIATRCQASLLNVQLGLSKHQRRSSLYF